MARDGARPPAYGLEELGRSKERLRARARVAVGITGERGTEPLRGAVWASGVGWYPLLALGVLVIVDEFQGYAFLVLGPEIAATLGLTKTALASVQALKTIAISLATLPMAAYVQHRPRRALLSVLTAFAWSLMTLLTGFVTSIWGLVVILVADGASTGSVRAVHTPLLVDSYPPSVRVRGLAFYRAADGVGNSMAPLIVGLLTAVLGFTWRGVFVAMGLVSLAAAVLSVRLRDPGFGRWDTAKVREVVREDVGRPSGPTESEEAGLGFFEIVRRLLLIPTVRRVLTANAVLGMLVVPFTTFLFFFLDERWNMGPGARGLFFGVMPVFSLAALAAFGRRGESMFQTDPPRLVRTAGLLLVGAVVSLSIAVLSPVFALMVLFFGGAFAMVAALVPALNMTLLSIVPPSMRPHAAALQGIALAAVGGFAGLVLLGGIDSRFGTAAAMISLAIPGVVAGLVLRSAARTVDVDLDRMIDEVVEEEEVRNLRSRGEKPPMLACRRIDFSYGQLQVLFDVDLNVDEGEMVALLGTNGAGKSTLLNVISGLGLPHGGTVRYRGLDITFLDAERRLRLGITQIPGGHAVFGPLTVVENLRAFGFTHGRRRGAVEAGIERSFEAFPKLAERRDQPASTLSGGEQQMLGLAAAFVVRPQLLLVDELSLGLAPKIVTELFEMVRVINAAGTAVVLVEQSVNLALTLVDHAYFMEKGEIRFDGPAKELLARPDLLRSVFLEGASRSFSGGEGEPSMRKPEKED